MPTRPRDPARRCAGPAAGVRQWGRVAALAALAACGIVACGGNDDVPGDRGELELESNADVHQAGAPAGVGPISAETLGTSVGPDDTTRIPPGGFPTGVTTAPNQTGATGAPAVEPATGARASARDSVGRTPARREVPDAERPYPGRPSPERR